MTIENIIQNALIDKTINYWVGFYKDANEVENPHHYSPLDLSKVFKDTKVEKRQSKIQKVLFLKNKRVQLNLESGDNMILDIDDGFSLEEPTTSTAHTPSAPRQ